MRIFGLLVPVLLAWPAGAAAQSLWLPAAEGRVLALEYVHPHAPADVRSAFTFDQPGPVYGAFFLGGAWPVGKGVRVLAEIPYAVVTGRTNTCMDAICLDDVHGDALGNPYLGVELPLVGRALRWQTGVRLPLQNVSAGSSDDYFGRYAAATGLEAARGEREEAFQKDVGTGTSLLELRSALGRGTSVRAQVGATLSHQRMVFYTWDEQRGDWLEHRHDWGMQWRGAAEVWQRTGPLVLGAGVFGVNRRRFYEAPRRTDYEWGASTGLQLAHFTPLLQARIPSYRPDVTAGESPAREWWNLAVAVEVRP